MKPDKTERLISAEICDDPQEIGLLTFAMECQRCGSDERVVAVIRFRDLPDYGCLAICGYCYREFARIAVCLADAD
jgi:hypothetical protein